MCSHISWHGSAGNRKRNGSSTSCPRKTSHSLPFDQEWLYGIRLLAGTAVLIGDATACDQLYGLLLPWGAFNAVDVAEGFRGSAARYLGQLAAAAGRLDDAQRHFDDALVHNKQMAARPWLARTQSDYAQMVLSRALPDDLKRAAELQEQGSATALELGIETLSQVVTSA